MSDIARQANLKGVNPFADEESEPAAEHNEWLQTYDYFPHRYLGDVDRSIVPDQALLRARGDGGDGEVAVDIEAIRQYARMAEELAPYCANAASKLREIAVYPGNFYDAAQMAEKVGSMKGGLVKAYIDSMKNLENALNMLSVGLIKISEQYESVEAFNEGAGAAIGKLLADVDGEFQVGLTPSA